MSELVTVSTLAKKASALGPWSTGWGTGTTVALQPSPLDAQPSAYVQEAWRERPYGKVPEVLVHCVQASGAMLVRMEWECESPRHNITDNDVFADACALLMPANGHAAPLMTMGSEAEPVVTWHWRAGAETAFVADGTGAGTLTRRTNHDLAATAEWKSGRWAVVFSHPAGTNGHTPTLNAGGLVAFAVWTGANQERGGLASCSPAWSRIQPSTGATA
ncbi:MAG: hypothetical protein LC118_18915 [Dehalococcoidia bacterium]|nr:hypothetical protein [Dehalococcoidia bacterium]